MSGDTFKIEVNGIELDARPGQMLIEVTDEADIYIPRFCYHKKLSVAANCRMCLVEVEKAPKPLPACATPVTDGMKVRTKSAAAMDAQKSVMEFLLINHPLDCPICDQGGECELQDLAMGYGRGISRYTERKRVVKDKNIGPLVSTDMTRCIHCTRCVRFTEEIQGYQQLGTIGRGDRTEIGTYIENSIDHELSGNIIDLCPVGALNNKPYRFSARAWEMVSLPTIAAHDCIGSNISAHVMGGKVKRIVPRYNETVNESWIADRDRFSCEGISSGDRLEAPILRDDGEWRHASWEEALDVAAEGLRRVGAELGVMVSPNATTEEGYLLGRIARHLGSDSIDHRLRRRDFRQQELDPEQPGLGCSIEAIENADAVLVIGSNLRKEVPLLAHRVRKAALGGASISFVNPARYEYMFDIANYDVDPELVGALDKVDAAALKSAERANIIIGQIAMRHPRFAEIRAAAARLAAETGATLGYATEGANAAGLSLAGALPHRAAGGKATSSAGKNAGDIVAQPPRGLILFGIEPEFDCADGEAALAAAKAADFVLAISPFLGESLNRYADIVLPLGTFAETSGTYVNAAGDWQSFGGVAQPPGESRPGWKILRVLGNLLEMPACEYESSESIRDEVRELAGGATTATQAPSAAASPAAKATASTAALDVPTYQVDALVRRARCLQLTPDGLAGRGESDERRIA
ncbi:MAG: NADH-quinone oxidoreductase subunit NuoG [Gammaproteobacteria bacterium]|nr:NADH-quinone oxidoreductase subunit NuoG [Gammaproteobacteria bacterium]